MAESAVVSLLDKIEQLLKEEEKLLVGVWKEVEYIKAEFMGLNAFLKDADVTEESDLELQVWVKEVREVALDTENVIDEFLLRMAPHHHRNPLSSCASNVCFSIKKLTSRHWFASEIRSIGCRVRELAEGHQSLSFSISGEGSSFAVVSDTWYKPRGDALLLGETELVGIDKPKQELISLLLEGDSERRVISVVGKGGLGKTALVKKVFEDAAVKKHFHSHAWLTVSQSPKMHDLLRDMIQQLFTEIKEPVPHRYRLKSTDTESLMCTIGEFLQQRRYLVVLDDVWDIQFWKDVNKALPSNNNASRVMLTTRSNDIAYASCGEAKNELYALHPLPREDSWTLFCSKAFWGNSCPPELKEISHSFLRRCKGLPLAIVAIGGVLATKNSLDEWEKLLSSLEVGLQDYDITDRIKNTLSLSFNHLPYYLKTCFLYLSIFPTHHEIECMRLIRLWMAEGFVQDSEAAGKTIEEVSEAYLHELINRSLIQVAKTTQDGRIKTCRVHYLLHDYVTSKSTEENIVASQENTRWPEKLRRLSIHNTLRDVQQSKHFSQLRSLFMFEVTDPESMSLISMLFTGGLRLLKVLDMRGASLETLPDEIFQLFHLRYLSLRGTKVKKVRSSIGNLENLQTLDLKDTYVTELPVQIQKLRRLRHLLVYRYDKVQGYRQFSSVNGFKALTGIGGLSCLQKLCYIDASNSRMVEELGKLTQLRRLGIVQLRREDGVALCFSIDNLRNLRCLAISSMDEDEIVDIQSLSSPPFLQRLYLRGRLEKLPNWIASLHNLVRVHLEWTKLEDDLLQSLQNLPNLVQIELHRAYEGGVLCFRSGGFQKLKTLRLSELNNLKSVVIEGNAMPHLEKLYIFKCELLEEVPSGIERLLNLKLLELGGVPYPLYRSLNCEMEGKDCWKIDHIPTVYIEVPRSRFSRS